jgi:putative oxidoreductase
MLFTTTKLQIDRYKRINKNHMINYNLLTQIGLFFLRIGISVLMLIHGIPKLIMLLNGNASQFADPIGIGPTLSLLLAIGAEVICSLVLITGFKSRLFALPLIINMTVAAFVVHRGEGFATQELALIYLLVYITIALTGSGKFSFDHYWNKRKGIKR